MKTIPKMCDKVNVAVTSADNAILTFSYSGETIETVIIDETIIRSLHSILGRALEENFEK